VDSHKLEVTFPPIENRVYFYWQCIVCTSSDNLSIRPILAVSSIVLNIIFSLLTENLSTFTENFSYILKIHEKIGKIGYICKFTRKTKLSDIMKSDIFDNQSIKSDTQSDIISFKSDISDISDMSLLSNF